MSVQSKPLAPCCFYERSCFLVYNAPELTRIAALAQCPGDRQPCHADGPRRCWARAVSVAHVPWWLRFLES